jgi:hypothetical protein
LVAAAAVVAAGFVEAPAWAGEPATQNSVQLGLGFRYGIEMNEGDFNPWGVGLGLDGGYTLPNAVYIGGNFDYFFGDTVEAGGVKLTGNVWQLMAEAGYDIGLGPTFVIRPKLGAGLGTLRAEMCVDGLGCNSDSSTNFALAPGVKAMLFLPHFELSVDLRYAMIFSDGNSDDPAGTGNGSSSSTGKALIFAVGVGF